MISRLLCTAIALCGAMPAFAADTTPDPHADADMRQRLVVLTDIEADPDDTQSLIRLFLYSNEIDIEGLVATTSTHRRNAPMPESIHRLVDGYAKVQPNLLTHDRNYPDAGRLRQVISKGSPVYGMAGVGDGKDTAGSDLIIQALERKDPRPLWVSVWGGANTLAQALHTLKRTRSAPELDRLLAKLRVYTISDQDDAGIWLRREFPQVFYIVTPGDDYAKATWNALSRTIGGIDNTTVSNPWLAQHIQQGHGPLGALYPDVVWGLEGDTPAFLHLIPNGLNHPERPDWGSWGGRYRLYIPSGDTVLNHVNHGPETRPIWTNAIDAYAPPTQAEYGRPVRDSDPRYRDALVSLWRWRDDFQNDFAARMDWTIKPPDEANHPPQAVLGQPARLTLKSGQGMVLSARGSSDPDGDSLGFHWFWYPEAGGFEGNLPQLANGDTTWIKAPEVDKPVDLHLILRVSDKGSPSLARYARTVVHVEP